MIRHRGYIYSAFCLIIVVLLGRVIGCILAAIIAVYALFIGEWYAKKKYGAIPCGSSYNNIHHEKLQRCFLHVKTKAESKVSYICKGIKVYIIPDQRIQAFTFGWRSIGVTEGALHLDARTLEALIAHEYGHIVNGDCVLNMVLTASTASLVIILGFIQIGFIAAVVLIIIVVCLFGLFRFNFLTYLVATKLTGGLKKIGECVIHGVFTICQIIIKAFCRKGELMADSFACSLGYAFYLRRFLERFDLETSERRTFFEALYETHPSREVRIRNLDINENNSRLQQ